MERTNFEKLRVYKLAEDLADGIWQIVRNWDYLAQDIGELSPKVNAYFRSVNKAALEQRKQSTKNKAQSSRA